MVQTRTRRSSSSGSDLTSTGKGAGKMAASSAASSTRPPRSSKQSSSRPPRSGNQRTNVMPPTKNRVSSSSQNGRTRQQAKTPLKIPNNTISSSSGQGEQAIEKDNTSHFLKGINFDEQTDWLAIPSPPSEKKKRSRPRRQSMSILPTTKATPLQDLTNNDDSRSPGDRSSRKKSSSNSNSSKANRKRRSLCHVPSPVDPRHLQEPPAKKRSPESKPSSVEASQEQQPPLELELALDLGEESDDEDGGIAAKKRNKRRQSILLPSESGIGQITAIGGFTTSATADQPQMIVEAANLENNAPDLANDKHNSHAVTVDVMTGLREMQKLVRSYCALPTGEARTECVDLIRSKTGYSLSLPAQSNDSTIDMNPSGDNQQDSFRSQRRDLLTRIGPAVERMERRKKAQAALTAKTTSCTVEKTRNGRYRYRNTLGVKIPTNEYKGRYLKMIMAAKIEKTMEYQALRQELESSRCVDHEDAEESDGQDPLKNLNNDDSSRIRVERVIEKADHLNEKYALKVEETTKKDEDMDLELNEEEDTVTSASIPDANKTIGVPVEHVLEGDEVDHLNESNRNDALEVDANPETDENMELDLDLDLDMNDREDTPTSEFTYHVSENVGAASPPKQHYLVTEKKHGVSFEDSREATTNDDFAIDGRLEERDEAMMLPFPDRDEESEDPEVAQAENKLWLAIDTALDEYSLEVLAIQTRKKARDST